ncbi:hypothetical protein DYB32_007894 [Aphanomyces invadans]|uniref:Uncharacterized protein n=1 Tax=Aphanomyces invadans TaxID=157072 RepID=A0A3R6WIH0_9STRA|nr:hypothetical protein DYB32_007894 [Aphanomyces invadans]
METGIELTHAGVDEVVLTKAERADVPFNVVDCDGAVEIGDDDSGIGVPQNTRTKPLSVCIPDTILLDRGVLQQWYFTSKTGEKVLRRKKDNTTKSKLLRYLHETAAGPIAAVHVYLVTEKRVLVVDHLSLAGVGTLRLVAGTAITLVVLPRIVAE